MTHRRQQRADLGSCSQFRQQRSPHLVDTGVGIEEAQRPIGATGERVPLAIASPLPAGALLDVGKCSPDSVRYTLNQR